MLTWGKQGRPRREIQWGECVGFFHILSIPLPSIKNGDFRGPFIIALMIQKIDE